MVLVTVCADELSYNQLKSLSRDFVSSLRHELFKKIRTKYRGVAEIEFFLKNPHDHAFGLFRGFEIQIRDSRVDPAFVKTIALTMERRNGKRSADIDVYTLNLKTHALRKYSRYSVRPKLIARRYTRI